MKTFLIIDNNSLIRLGLKSVILENFLDSQVFEASNGETALALMESHQIDLCYLSVNLPDVVSVEFVVKITSAYPNLKVLVSSLGSSETLDLIFFRNGAKGVINNTSDKESFILALTTVLNNSIYTNLNLIDSKLLNPNYNLLDILTEGEYKIALLLKDCGNNNKVTKITGLKHSTISTHKKNIFRKLAIKNTIQLAQLFQSYSPSAMPVASESKP